ncbi:hypothetical protein AOL_s00075g175 [Orbilia oligospora ATCC 24927]|uniref:Aminoglycoside phosphotransferase domain-containing protein n=2 Tax=Orbilia oligospora TaxID=2813651 RepID=G1X8H6_ARTOA|nr:hypothetical protein AOL_s00075g175 [Orbilia oligospora ATCC 24927]EGX50539.1 hypothetical protein AOL_s00075g175 [Orbilia oligospora ATCC 24927]KAF3281902.1 hypothetical protein TWF970_001855 [Orbilia oligospora]
MDISEFIPSAASYQAQAAHLISKFFETNELTTQQECDEHASSIADQVVSPTTLQGQKSYTVVAADESMVIQFRPPDCPLEVPDMDMGRMTYGRRFVPACVFRESWRGLFVYVMDAIQGEAFAIVRQDLYTKENKHILSSTMSDYFAFFAVSWTNRPATPPDVDIRQIYQEYDSRLSALSDTVPPKFYSKLNTARNQLWRIFDPSHPIVFNHGNLTDTNVHVDKTTGRITGVIDWSGSRLGPFGTSLYGVDIALGIQSMNEWHWHPNHVELRKQFWETLSNIVGPLGDDQISTMKIARSVGLFLTFGYCNGVPVEDDDSRLVYLDAFLGVE